MTTPIKDNYSYSTAHITVLGNKIWLHQMFNEKTHARRAIKRAASQAVIAKKEEEKKFAVTVNPAVMTASKRQRMASKGPRGATAVARS